MPKATKMAVVKTAEYKNRIFKKIIYQCEIRGYEDAEKQSIIGGMSIATFNRRKKKPGDLTLDEILNYANKFKMSVPDLLTDPLHKE